MKKATVLRFINNALMVLVSVQMISIVGFNLEIFADILFPVHKAVGALLILSAIVHLGLNWNWVKANMFRKSSPKASSTAK